MKFFIDTADVAEIRELSATGLIDGVTTNPTLMAKTGRHMMDVLPEICDAVDGPVSAEVTATDAATMIAEGRVLADVADNVVVKVPLTYDGLICCKTLADDGIAVNVTLCFSSGQALLAAKAGATFISPFVGRVDDMGQVGMDLISDIVQIYSNYDFDTAVLVASIRGPHHVMDAAKIGADVATLPPAVFRALYAHPLTDKGLAAFLADWEKTGQSILHREIDAA